MATGAKIRLFVDGDLAQGQTISTDAKQAHYLLSVMRVTVGDEVLVFNGTQGEWRAGITNLSKKIATLTAITQTRVQSDPPDLWLLFAPIKKTRTDFIVEKATELGVAKIQPVHTEFTNTKRINQERLQAHAIEAAEQCGGMFVPPVCALQPLRDLLQNWPLDRGLLFCDETSVDNSFTSFCDNTESKWAILIGPEGGFSKVEAAFIRSHEKARTMTLGPRILRADTAALAAITLWQSTCGDWS